MTIPEGNPADLAEQIATPTRDAPAEAEAGAAELPLEVSEADAAEQAATAAPGEHVTARDLPLESDDLDAAEQARVVELDEDEYR